jgi:hypothetical protein
MNSGSKPGPAGESPRRDFFQKIGRLAAASSVAANASAAQQQPISGGAALTCAAQPAWSQSGSTRCV